MACRPRYPSRPDTTAVALARFWAIRDDIYGAPRSLCFDVLAVGNLASMSKIAEWNTQRPCAGTSDT